MQKDTTHITFKNSEVEELWNNMAFSTQSGKKVYEIANRWGLEMERHFKQKNYQQELLDKTFASVTTKDTLPIEYAEAYMLLLQAWEYAFQLKKWTYI